MAYTEATEGVPSYLERGDPPGRFAANYRPLSSVMFFSRLLRERVAGTPYAEHFLAGEA